MSLQVSAIVLNEVVDLSATAYSKPMDVSGYKKIAIQALCASAGGGTLTVEQTSVSEAVNGGDPETPLAGSWNAITALSLAGGVWYNTGGIAITTKWVRVVFIEAVPSIENIKVVITAQG